MRTLDRKWTDLAAGYQTVQSLQAKLETEFGRAVQAGHKQKFRKELTEWQKKRRIFFALAALAPLSVITLCVTAYYLRDVACVIVYWAILVLVIVVTLAVAGRDYIREMMNRPELARGETLTVDLEQRWWASLSPKELTVEKPGEKNNADFQALLARSLPDTFLAARGLLFSASGVWVFVARDWSGTIVKQDGDWKQVLKRREETIPEPAPDDEWLRQKEKIVKTIEHQFPQRAWTVSLIQGGVVFTHPKAHLDKSRIRGNSAAYGPAKAWVERLRRAPSVDGFTLPVQLEILDALIAEAGFNERQGIITSSAKDEAEKLYQQAVMELRESVAKMVK